MVDTREPRVMRELLAATGLAVRAEQLRVGDYLVGQRFLVERKHVVDLHDTLMRGRLWPQLGRLRAAADEAYLLVEGQSLAGPVRPASIRGALLAAMELGITVIRSGDRPDSAAWLAQLARRREDGKRRHRPRYGQRPRSPRESLAESMLGSLPNFSHGTARALLDEFGTVSAIASADPLQWTRVSGMGPKRSEILAEALGIDAATSHSAKRNGNPST